MKVTYQDQRKNPTTKVAHNMDAIRVLCEKAGIPANTEVRIRIRNGAGPYGFTSPVGKNAYRVVLNIRNAKDSLSDAARYVVNNTLLHELRHVAQGEESGWGSLSGSYEGWSEKEAREYGRTIKGQGEFFALT